MIYQRCQGQLIMSMDGPVDINVLAVLAVMKLEGVEDERDCLDKVQTIAGTVIAKRQEARGSQEAG